MKESEDDTNKWKDILCLWIGKINIVKITILSKATYSLTEIPIKTPMTVFRGLEKIILIFVWKQKRP